MVTSDSITRSLVVVWHILSSPTLGTTRLNPMMSFEDYRIRPAGHGALGAFLGTPVSFACNRKQACTSPSSSQTQKTEALVTPDIDVLEYENHVELFVGSPWSEQEKVSISKLRRIN